MDGIVVSVGTWGAGACPRIFNVAKRAPVNTMPVLMNDSANQLVERGLQAHMVGQFPQAQEMYRQALAADPNHAGALHLLGVAASQQGKKLQAIDLIARAIAINPNVADFHVNLALVYIELGNPVKAIPCCQRAMQLQPNHADAFNHMGVALSQLAFAASDEAEEQAGEEKGAL